MELKRRSDKIDVLKQVPLFSDLNKKQLNEIAKHADVVSVQAETLLAEQGKLGSEFVFILSGKVQVVHYGKEVREMSPGEFFGEISLIDGGPRTASIITKTDVSLLVVHKRSFDHLLKNVPGLSQKMLLILCQYLRKAEQGML